MQISTLVVAEQEGGLIRPSSLSALAAAGSIGHDNSISVLLAGTGSSLHKAVSQAAGLPTVSQVGGGAFIFLSLLPACFLAIWTVEVVSVEVKILAMVMEGTY